MTWNMIMNDTFKPTRNDTELDAAAILRLLRAGMHSPKRIAEYLHLPYDYTNSMVDNFVSMNYAAN